MRNIKEIQADIQERKERLEHYKNQDETNFSDFDLAVKGKEVNMWLIRNHISYYENELNELKNNSLEKWL